MFDLTQLLPQQHVLVLGHGISGQAMARWCVRQGALVTIADTRAQPELMQRLQSELAALAAEHGTVAPEVLSLPFDEALMTRQPWRVVCKSPGLSPVQLQGVTNVASAQGVPLIGELDLFAHGLRQAYANAGFAPKLLAITGTNGKTTTTSLTGQLLERAGLRAAVAGNIGPAMLDVLGAAQEIEQKCASAHDVKALTAINSGESEAPADKAESTATDGAQASDASDAVADTPESTLPQVWVLELSSFQLDGVRTGPSGFEPTAGTVLNISQDHLDWHGSMAHYTQAKFRVFGQQALRVLNREDTAVMVAQPQAPVAVKLSRAEKEAAKLLEPVAAPLPVAQWVTFGTDAPRRPGDWGLETVNGMTWLVRAMPADETRQKKRGALVDEELVFQRLMPAEALRIRGRHNAANALAALALASAAGAALAPMLYGLREYQGEPHRVESVAVVDDVEYFDDSKGTNVGATLAAIKGLGAERRLVMILGGDGKGQDFSPLADAVAAHVQAAVLIGRDAPRLREALAHTGVPLFDAIDMPQAVALATEQAQAGHAVVMSPACASLDMFRNYAHRAEVFCDAVHALATERGMA